MDKKKVLLWGFGNDYELMINPIRYEIQKENISVIAVVCRDSDKYCNRKDGLELITKDDIRGLEYDYIIVISRKFYDDIVREAKEIGVSKSKIIDGSIFTQPLFDFKRYASLIERPVTILSDDCWGGYAYHRLKLPFSSPLINIYWNRSEYAKFISKPFFYLNTELQREREGDLEKGICPIGKLGTSSDSVVMELIHNVDFAEAKEQWDRRKKRINPNNILVKMGFSQEVGEEQITEYIQAFKEVKYNKVLFFNGIIDMPVKGQLLTNRFVWRQKSDRRVRYFDYNAYLRDEYNWDIDLLKLLNGEDDFSRYS